MQLWLTVSRFLLVHGFSVSNHCRPSSSSELERVLASIRRKDKMTEPIIIFTTIERFCDLFKPETNSPKNLAAFQNRMALVTNEGNVSPYSQHLHGMSFLFFINIFQCLFFT